MERKMVDETETTEVEQPAPGKPDTSEPTAEDIVENDGSTSEPDSD